MVVRDRACRRVQGCSGKHQLEKFNMRNHLTFTFNINICLTPTLNVPADNNDPGVHFSKLPKTIWAEKLFMCTMIKTKNKMYEDFGRQMLITS